jgi:thiopeptide-type bacteriocin biosynthesis protein
MSRRPQKPTPARYGHSGLFAWRTALLPLAELFDSPETVATGGNDPEQFAAAVETDRARLRARLRQIVARPVIREALFLASPSLNDQVDAWLAGPDSEKTEKVERSLLRYIARSCGRATPFGLFAGCSVGKIDRQTRLTFEGLETYRRHTRLDMEYLCTLAKTLASDRELQGELTFRPNSTLSRAAGYLRYAESRFDGNRRSYHLVAVEESDYLGATLARAAAGARAADLAAALVDDEISFDEATAFIVELIATQLLVPEFEPSVTGDEPIHDLIDRLAGCKAAAPIRRGLVVVRDVLAEFDSAPLGIDAGRYRAIAAKLEQLPARVQLSRLFQVDLVKPAAEATLGTAVIDELQRAVEILHGISARPTHDPLGSFRSDFRERYGERMVPLTEVLDEEMGIGFERSTAPEAEGAPLLAGLSFPALGENMAPWGGRQQFLFRKLTDVVATGARQLELTPDDLKQLATADPLPLPDAISIAASIAAKSPEALETGDFTVSLMGIVGPSGARLLGRFCHGDARLTELVAAHLRAEEALRPDAIFAEVVHLPEGRIGNVLLRPVLRDYEISFAGRSGAAEDRQIELADLMVAVVGDRVQLWSRRLGREIIPRMSTAHNFSWNSLGVYRLLCQLQTQGLCPWLAWNWGALAGAPFLPRVTIGRLVLARAQWSLSAAEIKELSRRRGAEAFRAVQQWRERRVLPRFVSLVDDDNELPFDLDRVLCVETLLDLLGSRPGATLVEFFPTPDDLAASGPEGRFVHELVVPLVRIAESAKVVNSPDMSGDRHNRSGIREHSRIRASGVAAEISRIPLPTARRQFTPGSEWLYLKLYCGTAASDQILRNLVRPVTSELLESQTIDRWFFIRYGDPDWHLRIRLHGDPRALLREALPAIERASVGFLADGRIRRWQIDTYDREVERYGGPIGIELAESLFHVDSEAALSLIEACPGDSGLDARWRLALAGIDRLLDDFGLLLDAKLRIMRESRDGMGAEFHAEAGLTPQLAQKFRGERKGLEELLARPHSPTAPLAPGLAILDQRSRGLAQWLDSLRMAESRGELLHSREQLAPAFIHMFANRLLRSAHRAQELVLYDFLARLYQSQHVRGS